MSCIRGYRTGILAMAGPFWLLGDTTYAVAQSGIGNLSDDDWAILIMLVIAGIVYVIPTIVAFKRQHPNRWPIFLINIIFGATGLGWFGVLIWAMSAVHKSATGSDGGESGLNLFVNDPVILRVEGSDNTEDGQIDFSEPPAKGPVDQSPGQSTVASTEADTSGNKLLHLKRLRDSGALTDAEFARMRQPIIDDLMS